MKTIGQYLATALDRENTSQQLLKAKEQLSEHARLLEQRVHERTSRLQETVSELETFSYTIAHDLRAPVRGTTGYCEVLLEDFGDELPPGARKFVEKIAQASSRMETLTRDLLEFSRVSRQEIELSRVEIEPILDDLMALRVPTVRQAITISAPLHPVRAHRGLLQHVFSNLIDNAVNFVPPEVTPKITISAEVVPHGSPNTRSRTLIFSSTDPAANESASSTAQSGPNQVRIWVRDEGIGIPFGAHQKIFGIFERGVTSEPLSGHRNRIGHRCPSHATHGRHLRRGIRTRQRQPILARTSGSVTGREVSSSSKCDLRRIRETVNKLVYFAGGRFIFCGTVADVAELADALDSKSGIRKDVWVRPPPSAPSLLFAQTSEADAVQHGRPQITDDFTHSTLGVVCQF